MKEKLIALIKEAKNNKRKVFICGNGGSACSSIHFAEDLMSKGVRAMSLCDIGFLTATANDFNYEQVFSRHLGVWGDQGDVLVTISASGTSPNIVHAQKTAEKMGITVFAFPTNGELNTTTPRTEDVHIKLIHDVYESFS